MSHTPPVPRLDLIFLSGESAGRSWSDVVVIDDHHRAGVEYATAMREAAWKAGRPLSVTEFGDYMAEGARASRWAQDLGHRLSVREYHEIERAAELLRRHGYRVLTPRARGGAS